MHQLRGLTIPTAQAHITAPAPRMQVATEDIEVGGWRWEVEALAIGHPRLAVRPAPKPPAFFNVPRTSTPPHSPHHIDTTTCNSRSWVPATESRRSGTPIDRQAMGVPLLLLPKPLGVPLLLLPRRAAQAFARRCFQGCYGRCDVQCTQCSNVVEEAITCCMAEPRID